MPHRSWVWLLALFTFASLIEVIFWGQLSAFTPLYLPHLGIAPHDVRRWVGIISAVSATVGIPLVPLWGALADRFSRQPLIIRSFFVHALIGVLTILASNVWIFLAARALSALSLGNTGLMLSTLTERVPEGRRGLAYSIMNGSQPLGVFIGPLLGGPLLDRIGFRALLGIDVALLLVVVVALSVAYRDTYRPQGEEPVLRMAVESVTIIAGSARLRTLFPALFLLSSGWMLAITYLPLAVTGLYHGHDPGTAVGTVIGLGGLTALIISPAAGLLADRTGHWRVLIAGTALSVFLWPLPALAHGLALFAVLWALIAGVLAANFSLGFSVLSTSVGDAIRGRIMSFSFLPTSVALAIGPLIGTVVTAHAISAVFPTAAGLTMLGVGALIVARRQPAVRTAGHSEIAVPEEPEDIVAR
ncbi:MAG TPA: MFS transporter [Chloroflexota bacterium]|nr:MFS transporter [Chloroflexota bacterium]